MTIFSNFLRASEAATAVEQRKTKPEGLLASFAPLREHPEVIALRQDPATTGKRIATTAAPGSYHYGGEALGIMLYGLSIKGSGGGGGLIDGLDIWLKLDLDKGVDIYNMDSVQDDELYMVVGGLGAPSALKQNLDGLINAIQRCMKKLAELKGKRIGGILSVESGPVNSMLAILLSQRLAVPLIDVDGAGRSVPSLTNLTYAYERYPIAPVVAGSALNPSKDLIVKYPQTAAQAEEELREVAAELGGLIGISLWGQTGAELKASNVVRDTFWDAFWLGLYVIIAAEDPPFLAKFFEATQDYIHDYSGHLTRFHIDSSGGFDKIYLDFSEQSGRSFTINAVNEDLLMEQSAPQPGVAVTAPHIIAYMVQVSPDSAYLPFNNGDVDVLKRVAEARGAIYVLAAQASAQLYGFEQSFLAILAKVYGYSGPVVPPYRPH